MYIRLKSSIDQNIKINGPINIPKGFLTSTKIKSLNCFVNGFLDSKKNLSLNVKGKIKTTSIYTFELEISKDVTKYLQNNQNALDINLIVWENILLEVPLDFMEEKQGLMLDIIPESGRSE